MLNMQNANGITLTLNPPADHVATLVRDMSGPNGAGKQIRRGLYALTPSPASFPPGETNTGTEGPYTILWTGDETGFSAVFEGMPSTLARIEGQLNTPAVLALLGYNLDNKVGGISDSTIKEVASMEHDWEHDCSEHDIGGESDV